MSAPSSTVWGSIVNSKGRIGIYTSVSSTNTQSTVTVQVYFWSKYSVSDSNNSYYYNNNASSATTLIGSKTIKHTVATGSGWSTSNQTLLGSATYTYSRGTSASTKYCAAKFTGIDVVGSAMTVSTSYTIPKLATYTVSYNANGGSGAPSSQTKTYGVTLTLSSTKPTRTGYTFKGWATSSSGSVAYSAGGSYTNNAAITLYAVWSINTYTVSYNANGGSGAPSSQTKTYGVTLTLSSTTPTRTNYNFKGWATSSSGSVAYSAGGSYTANAAITLYAVWELAYTTPTITNYKAYRCDEDGNSDETAAYFDLSFSWSCCQLTGENNVASITMYYVNNSTSASSSTYTISASGTSGSCTGVYGGGAISTDITYIIYIVVTDSMGGSTTKTITLSGAAFVLDFLSDGTGAAFGKPAETDNTLDVNMYAIFRKTATFKSTLTVNDYVSIWSDSEGGNLQITAPSSYGKYWQIDAYNGNLRAYCNNGSTNYFPIELTTSSVIVRYALTVPSGHIWLDQADSERRLAFRNNAYINGETYSANSVYPHYSYLYGANESSTTAIGVYDYQNGVTVWNYNDYTHYKVSTQCIWRQMVAIAVATSATTISATSTWTKVTLASITSVNTSFLSLSNGGIKCEKAGVILISASAVLDSLTSGDEGSLAVWVNSTAVGHFTAIKNANVSLSIPPRYYNCSAGDIVYMYICNYTGARGSLRTAAQYSRLVVQYVD